MKKAIIIIISIVLITLAAAGTYILHILGKVEQISLIDADSGQRIIEPVDLGISDEAPKQKDTGVVNILLFGIDSRNSNEPARSDTIMIATIDKKNKSIKLTSLMRDMYLPIPDRQDNRINTAYIFGGPSLAIKTVNSSFNMSIENFVTVDFFSLEGIIDEVGGISIDVSNAEVREINRILKEQNSLQPGTPAAPPLSQAGLQTLSGRQAVAYSRIRKVGRDDFERTARQRKVLNALFKKAKGLGVTKVPDLVSKVLPNVQTSLGTTEILELAVTMLGFNLQEIEQFRIPADGHYRNQYVGEMLVLMPDLDANKQLLHAFIYGVAE